MILLGSDIVLSAGRVASSSATMTLLLLSPIHLRTALKSVSAKMSIAPTAFSAAVAVLPSLVAGQEHEPETVEHFKVFHVEWPRVEVPYVVFVWILTTIFVKLGGF